MFRFEKLRKVYSLAGGLVLTALFASSTVIPAYASTSNNVIVDLTQSDAQIMRTVLGDTNTSLGLGVSGQSSNSSVVVGTFNANSQSGSSGKQQDVIFSMQSTPVSALVFNESNWNQTTSSSQNAILSDFTKELQKSGMSTQDQQSVINTLEQSDSELQQLLIPITMNSAQANIFGATQVVSPFMPTVALIFGIGVYVIMIALILSSIIDLAFIGLPIGREKMLSRTSEKGNSGMYFVSHDAVSVVKETESDVGNGGGYKNVYLLYFKRRIVTYIVLSICVLYLVSGQLGSIISWLFSIVHGTVSSN